MPESVPEAPDYRVLLDALGYPPIRGGAEDDPPDPPEQDTPPPTGDDPPDGDTPPPDTDQPDTPEVDYESRYNDLRSEFDRRNQVIAALEGRHGPEAQAQAAQLFGFELEDEDTDDEVPLDPDERIEKLEQHLARQQEEAEEQAFQKAEEEWLTDARSKLPEQVDDKEWNLIRSYAVANRLDDGQPNVEQGYKAFEEAFGTKQERYLQTKKAPKVPIGSAGQKQVDLNDDDQRREYFAQLVDAESGPDT